MKIHHYTLLLLCCLLTITTFAAPSKKTAVYYESIVYKYGKALKEWSENKRQPSLSNPLLKMTKGEGTTVDNAFMKKLLVTYPYDDENKSVPYNMTNYIRKIRTWFKDNKTSTLRLTDVKEIKEEDMVFENNEDLTEEYIVFQAKLEILSSTGEVQNEYKDKFFINRINDKICRIDVCELDYTSGKQKIKVDFSDLKDETTLGVSANYSKNWPISFSGSYSVGFFMISADFGIDTDHNQIVQNRLYMNDVLNYTQENITYDPCYYITITPSVYLKYFSIGCGTGVMVSQKTIKRSNAYYNYEGNDSFNTEKYHYGTNGGSSKPYCSFMLRPNIKGYIPLSDEWSLTVNASYDWVMDIKMKNGLSFGLGFQYRLY